MTATVSETVLVAVPPARAYAAVSDVTRMGEWSPECTGATCRTPSAPLTVGSRFTGHNRAGRRRVWSTRCTVTAATPGRRFAFDVTLGTVVASWSYDFEPVRAGTGTRITESWTDRRGPLRRRLSHLLTGVADRAAHNRATMRRTLDRLRSSLESC